MTWLGDGAQFLVHSPRGVGPPTGRPVDGRGRSLLTRRRGTGCGFIGARAVMTRHRLDIGVDVAVPARLYVAFRDGRS